MKLPTGEWLTIEQAAQLIDRDPQHIRRMIMRGALTQRLHTAEQVRIHRVELLQAEFGLPMMYDAGETAEEMMRGWRKERGTLDPAEVVQWLAERTAEYWAQCLAERHGL